MSWVGGGHNSSVVAYLAQAIATLCAVLLAALGSITVRDGGATETKLGAALALANSDGWMMWGERGTATQCVCVCIILKGMVPSWQLHHSEVSGLPLLLLPAQWSP